MEISMEAPQKLKIQHPYDPAIPTVYTQNNQTEFTIRMPVCRCLPWHYAQESSLNFITFDM
jgi:hypothetical protein